MMVTLALRNIWRNRRRTLLTLSAMIVSLSLLILSLGVYSGMIRDMLASATEQYRGHVVVSRVGYQDDHDLFATFRPSAELEKRIAADPQVVGLSPRLRAYGLVAHGQNTRPAELLGIEPRHERQVTRLQEHLTAGHYPTDRDNGALIGRGLADRLGVGPGDELIFVTQAADGSIGNDLLPVSGIFATGDSRQDNQLVLVSLPWLQNLMVLPGQVHEMALALKAPLLAGETAGRLDALLPGDLDALSWGELLPEMQEAIASYDVSRLIMAGILYFATGLGILNTLFMSVMERTREFGILMALGMTPWRIRTLVLLETLLMSCLALAVGLALGLAMTFYMDQVGIDLSGTLTPITYAGGTILPRLHAVFEPANLTVPALLLLLVALLAGWLPANRAARLRPVQALREE
jgi:ABC-type lipoprotein release transport system permease subunit